MRLLVASRTDVGRVRTGNEDALVVADDACLVAVADGMGGHQAGEVASQIAIAELVAGVGRGDAIDAAITDANDAVFTRASEDQSLRGMGTTITAGILDGATLRIGHVGDSRAYLLRDGELVQLTTDHSVIAELMAAGELTEEEALVDPRRSMITRALGIEPTVEVDAFAQELQPGDRLLLCSDGLTTMLRDERIGEILVAQPDREQAADALVAEANDAGGADNITVVIADVVADDAGENEPDDAPGEPRDDDTEPDVPTVDDLATETPTAAESEPEPNAVAEPDQELKDLRAALEEETRRRRWWRRRS